MIKRDLSQADYDQLNCLIPLIKGISTIFGSNCEVSIHSMDNLDHSIIAIENGFVTGRDVGDGMIPMMKDRFSNFHDEENSTPDDDVIGIFYHYSKSGHPLKSIAVLLRNIENTVIGCIGIHIDVSIPLNEFVQGFLPSVNGGMMEEFNDHIPNDTDQLIDTALHDATNCANALKGASMLERNRVIVKELNNRGIFNIRGSVETVAKELGTSRYTIYNYLRDVKE